MESNTLRSLHISQKSTLNAALCRFINSDWASGQNTPTEYVERTPRIFRTSYTLRNIPLVDSCLMWGIHSGRCKLLVDPITDAVVLVVGSSDAHALNQTKHPSYTVQLLVLLSRRKQMPDCPCTFPSWCLLVGLSVTVFFNFVPSITCSWPSRGHFIKRLAKKKTFFLISKKKNNFARLFCTFLWRCFARLQC